MKEKAIFALGILISLLLLLWIYYVPRSDEVPEWSLMLPGLNAFLNASSAYCLLRGFVAIKRGRQETHVRWMLTAVCISALFLISYLTYHHFHGNVKFLGEGLIRPVYFFILITHIVLSGICLPMILLVLYFAASKKLELHKKLARWTFPIWTYVSVTGVLIYLIQKYFNHA